jgi:hypothetical protein
MIALETEKRVVFRLAFFSPGPMSHRTKLTAERQEIRATIIAQLKQADPQQTEPPLAATVDMLEEIFYMSLQDLLDGAMHSQASVTDWTRAGAEQDPLTLDHLALSLRGHPTLAAIVANHKTVYDAERQRQLVLLRQQHSQQKQQQKRTPG